MYVYMYIFIYRVNPGVSGLGWVNLSVVTGLGLYIFTYMHACIHIYIHIYIYIYIGLTRRPKGARVHQRG